MDSHLLKFCLCVESLNEYDQKNREATLLLVDFSKAFDSIHKEKMEELHLAYALHKDTVTAIIMIYKNTKAMVRSPNGDNCFIITGVLQGDTLALVLLII